MPDIDGGGEGFAAHSFLAEDGLRLAARIYGESIDGPLPVVCLPGLTRNARDFHRLALHLSRRVERPRKVIVFDYRGRGRSSHDGNWRNYNVLTEAGDVLAGLTAFGVGHAVFVGTSRGGLIVFALAGMRPTIIGAVVLNDIGPEVGGAGLAQIRAFLERAPKPKDWQDAVAILRAGHGQAFPALTDEDWEHWAHAIHREDKGKIVPDYDPALLKTIKGIDFNQPLQSYWPQFGGLGHVPLLAIRGATSKLLSAETLAAMEKAHPRISTVTVDGQGHAPMLETAGLPERIATFLDQTER